MERREEVARSREALRSLKPAELRTLTLLGEGYSYAEIGEITGFSRTKVNRCLAEGRERFRRFLAGSEDGRRCAQMLPFLSAFCDGEADPAEEAEIREHLRACVHCRAVMRSYRRAPASAAALSPLFAIPAAGLAAGGGVKGIGGGALAKLAAVCTVTAATATCVVAGVLPSPADLAPDRAAAPRIERSAGRALERRSAANADERAARQPALAPQRRERVRSEGPDDAAPPAAAAAAPEAAPAPEAPLPTEAPPAEAPPPPVPAPTAEAAPSGAAAGEFGP